MPKFNNYEKDKNPKRNKKYENNLKLKNDWEINEIFELIMRWSNARYFDFSSSRRKL